MSIRTFRILDPSTTSGLKKMAVNCIDSNKSLQIRAIEIIEETGVPIPGAEILSFQFRIDIVHINTGVLEVTDEVTGKWSAITSSDDTITFSVVP